MRKILKENNRVYKFLAFVFAAFGISFFNFWYYVGLLWHRSNEFNLFWYFLYCTIYCISSVEE